MSNKNSKRVADAINFAYEKGLRELYNHETPKNLAMKIKAELDPLKNKEKNMQKTLQILCQNPLKVRVLIVCYDCLYTKMKLQKDLESFFDKENSVTAISFIVKANSVEKSIKQIDPNKESGEIDQDTGNCMLASKLILLKLKGLLEAEVRLKEDVLNAFYKEKRIEKDGKVFVYGYFEGMCKESRSSKLKEIKRNGWWAFGGKVDDGTDFRNIYRYEKIDGQSDEREEYELCLKAKYKFNPKFKNPKVSKSLMRYVGIGEDFAEFLELLKKYFGTKINIDEKNKYSLEEFSKNKLIMANEGESYIVRRGKGRGRPHYFVFHIIKKMKSYRMAIKIDPWEWVNGSHIYVEKIDQNYLRDYKILQLWRLKIKKR